MEINIQLSSYNLNDAKLAVIRAAIQYANEQGGIQQTKIGEMLGMEGSTVNGYIKDYNIEWKRPLSQKAKEELDRKTKEKEEEKAIIKNGIDYLKQLGYKIIPPDPDKNTEAEPTSK